MSLTLLKTSNKHKVKVQVRTSSWNKNELDINASQSENSWIYSSEWLNLLHENHEEAMDDAEETIIDLGSVTLKVFHSPL